MNTRQTKIGYYRPVPVIVRADRMFWVAVFIRPLTKDLNSFVREDEP